MTQSRLWAFFFLINISTFASVHTNEDAFLCGMYGGCLADLEKIKTVSLDVLHILEADASKRFRSLPEDDRLRSSLLDLRERLKQCESQTLANCPIPRAQLDQAIIEKVHFCSAKQEGALFPWTNEEKERYKTLVRRKLCSGDIRLKTLRSLDGLFFFNTEIADGSCLAPLAKARGIELDGSEIRVQVNGMNATTKITVSNGKSAEFHYIVIGGLAHESMEAAPDRLVGLLDETVIHEFVHREREINPSFKKTTNEFVAFRFHKVREEFQKLEKDFLSEIRKKSDELTQDSSLSDEKKTVLLQEFVTLRTRIFFDEIRLKKIPVRYGPGSENQAIVKGQLTQPREYKSPEFKNGVPKSNALVVSGVFDDNPLKDEEEYIATALAMYRLDRKSALQIYSSDEITWLESHWILAVP